MIKKKILELFNRYPNKYFSLQEIKNYSRADRNSLKVVLSRMAGGKLIYSLGRSYYCKNISSIDLEQFACQFVYPSYISLEKALSIYGILSQIPASITLVTTRRSLTFESASQQIEYSHLKPALFFGFEIKKGTAIALPEKALLDELYLISLGKRTLMIKELNLSMINKKKIKGFALKYPKTTQQLFKKLF